MNISSREQEAVQNERPVINHIALYVCNLQRSTSFYTDVLQLKNIPEPFKDGKHSWFQIGEGCQLHLIEGAKTTINHHINSHISFSIASFDSFVESIRGANVIFYDAEKKPGIINIRPDGIKQIFLQDPDGYWLEVNNESSLNL